MARMPVLTAVADATWEAGLVAAFEQRDVGVTVVRRCVDLADLLAAAQTGVARAVLVSSDLRRLDREALARLASTGLAVVGLTPPGDESAERRLRQLGLATVLSADAAADVVGGALLHAAAAAAVMTGAAGGSAPAYSDPGAALPELSPEIDGSDSDASDPLPARGRMLAVWGPTGAPGRTTVALSLASELAALGRAALLVDADCYGGTVAQLLGLLEEAPGLAAAARAANAGALDVPALAALCRDLGPASGDLRVLPGIVRAERWPELRPSSLEVVLSLARRLAEVTVVDVGFCLESDEELAYDTLAPRRNGATLEVLATADEVIAVGSADPVGLQRLVRGLASLREAVPDAEVRVVVNRLRGSAIPGDAAAQVRQSLLRHAGVEVDVFVPLDVEGFDRAVVAGRPLGEVAPQSPARRALAALAASCAGVRTGSRRRGLLARR